jgi:hypothetical protein
MAMSGVGTAAVVVVALRCFPFFILECISFLASACSNHLLLLTIVEPFAAHHPSDPWTELCLKKWRLGGEGNRTNKVHK